MTTKVKFQVRSVEEVEVEEVEEVEEVRPWEAWASSEQDVLHPPLVVDQGHHRHHGHGPLVDRPFHLAVHAVVHGCSVPLALGAPVGVKPGGEEIEEGEEEN